MSRPFPRPRRMGFVTEEIVVDTRKGRFPWILMEGIRLESWDGARCVWVTTFNITVN